MEGYEQGMSFGKDAAEIYDDVPRGDEPATVAFLEELAATSKRQLRSSWQRTRISSR